MRVSFYINKGNLFIEESTFFDEIDEVLVFVGLQNSYIDKMIALARTYKFMIIFQQTNQLVIKILALEFKKDIVREES